MGQGYIFWCSSCKKDHAGDCPPAIIKSVFRVSEAKISINGQQIKGGPAWPLLYQPITIKLPPSYPAVGSVWEVEDLKPGSQLWVPRGPGFQYEVLSHDPITHLVTLKHTTYGSRCLLDVSAWNSTGMQVGNMGSYRMAPMAPVGTTAPAVGSLWNAETCNGLGQWSYSNGKYRILSVVGDQVEIEPEANHGTGTRYTYALDHWDPNGVASLGRLRFVPA